MGVIRSCRECEDKEKMRRQDRRSSCLLHAGRTCDILGELRQTLYSGSRPNVRPDDLSALVRLEKRFKFKNKLIHDNDIIAQCSKVAQKCYKIRLSSNCRGSSLEDVPHWFKMEVMMIIRLKHFNGE